LVQVSLAFDNLDSLTRWKQFGFKVLDIHAN
jgi:hypothetical protein